MKKVLKTKIVPVYDIQGNLLSQITLPEAIVPVVGRRGGISDTGRYYKGAGTVYEKHYSNTPKFYEIIFKETGLIYQKFAVVNPNIIGKFGIFSFQHQPVFSDFEGGCGPKEKKLVDNFKTFERTNILEIEDVLDTFINDHKIYIYRTKNPDADPLKLPELLEYILSEDWNTAWDKDIWSDIVMFGYVRDIADWFVSPAFTHKIGTVYGVLSSLYRADKHTYTFILDHLFGYNYFSPVYIPYLAGLIVKKFSPESVPDMDLENLTPDLYKSLLLYIYHGKACCHLEFEDRWAWVKTESIDKYLTNHLNAFQYELFLSGKRFHHLNCLNKYV